MLPAKKNNRKLRLTILISCLLIHTLLITTISTARTWYIKSDGAGDAPTIQTGIDNATAGDTVLVAEGTYFEQIVMKGGISLISESGPTHTIINMENNPNYYYIIRVFQISASAYRTEINGFWLKGLSFSNEGAISVLNSEDIWLINNIITDNAIGISIHNSHLNIINNTTNNNSWAGIDGTGGGFGVLTKNIFWDTAYNLGLLSCALNNFLNISDAAPYQNSNFSLDPQFCGSAAGNFYLQSDSPCAPENPPYPNKGLVGALPLGCGSVDTHQKTWGEIKALFSE